MSSGRGRKRDVYGDLIIEALHDRFPKFGRVQLSLIRNPAYGLQLSSEAVLELSRKGITPPGKASQKTFKNYKRTKQNKITVRLNDTDKILFEKAKEKSGAKTVQEFLESMIQENLNA